MDRKILRALLEDGRQSSSSLADQVGLSASPCWQRIKRLENDGVITGYTAILDQAFLGASETVVVEIMLDRHDDITLEQFGIAMSQIPEVLEAYLISGEYDYFIKVAVSGTAGYEEFIRTKLNRIPGIRHTRSSFILRCLKRQFSLVPS